MPVDRSLQAKLLSDIAARAASQKRDNPVHSGSDTPSVRRIPTGSPQLDYATGGGVPIGRWTRLFGGKSSGKSLTCWNIIKHAQAMDMDCVYYNIEGQFDKDYTARTGVDVDRLKVVEGAVIEDVGFELETLLGGFHVHVLDSCSEASSLQEHNAEYGDSLYAAKVRAWSQVFYKVVPHFDLHENVIVYCDQIRDSFGQGGVHPPGGNLMEHRSSLTLYFKATSWLFRKDNGRLSDDAPAGKSMHGRTEADGIEVAVRVEKSRVGRPFRQAVMHYDLDDARLDVAWELAQAAGFFDEDGKPAHKSGKPSFIEKSSKGGWFTLPDGSKVQGEDQLAIRLEEDDELRESVVEMLARAT